MADHQHNEGQQIMLTWKKYTSMVDACKTVRGSCIYVIVDRLEKPLYIGETGRKDGLDGRYHGGNASSLDAALEGSGNTIYVTLVPESQRKMVEECLIFVEKPKHNRRRTPNFLEPSTLRHHGEVPAFTHLTCTATHTPAEETPP